MTGSALIIRQLELADMDAAACVHRTAFDHALPWLTGLHTPDEDRWFYRERVFTGCQVHGAFEGGALAAIIAFRSGGSISCMCCRKYKDGASAANCCRSQCARSIASSFGRFSAIWERDASTKRGALRLSNKQTAQATRKKSRTRAISGRARNVMRYPMRYFATAVSFHSSPRPGPRAVTVPSTISAV